MESIFSSYYFRFLIDIIVVSLLQVAQSCGRALILGEKIVHGNVAQRSFVNLFNFWLRGALVHFLISLAMLMFIESDTNSSEYALVLENMDSGVMLISKNSKDVKYSN